MYTVYTVVLRVRLENKSLMGGGEVTVSDVYYYILLY